MSNTLAVVVVGGLYGELPHRRYPDVNGNGPQAASLQRNAPSGHGRLREALAFVL